MNNYTLSNLRELEAEAIHIIREVAAEFENPVMLYSIGKDSSVMVRLAEKAFYPGKVPFPMMHIDSKWKFREMTEFRDQYAKENGWIVRQVGEKDGDPVTLFDTLGYQEIGDPVCGIFYLGIRSCGIVEDREYIIRIFFR